MEDQVLEWFGAYCAGKLEQQEAESLKCWLDESAENRKTFEKYLRIVKFYRMEEGEWFISDSKAWNVICRKIHKNRIKRLFRYYSAIAAMFVMLWGIGWLYLFSGISVRVPVVAETILPGTTKATLVLADGSKVDLTCPDLKEVKEEEMLIENDSVVGLQYDRVDFQKKQLVWHTIKVPVTGEYHFILSDGTKVWMNSASELRFPVSFVGDTREVYTEGEVYFEVEHNVLQPFIVHSSGVRLEVLGTKFNVCSYEGTGKVVTTLAQGSVNVVYAGQSTLLEPGYQAVTDRETKVTECLKVNADMYISWIKGIFEYENMSLSEIAGQLSRWYDVHFIFADTAFKSRCFTGIAKRYESLNEVLKIVEKTTDVSFRIEGKKIIVQSAVRMESGSRKIRVSGSMIK